MRFDEAKHHKQPKPVPAQSPDGTMSFKGLSMREAVRMAERQLSGELPLPPEGTMHPYMGVPICRGAGCTLNNCSAGMNAHGWVVNDDRFLTGDSQEWQGCTESPYPRHQFASVRQLELNEALTDPQVALRMLRPRTAATIDRAYPPAPPPPTDTQVVDAFKTLQETLVQSYEFDERLKKVGA